MTAKDVKKLKVGSKVRWTDPACAAKGEVIEKGYCAVKVAWDDGQVSALHFDDCDSMVPA